MKPDVRLLDLKCQNEVENDEFSEFVEKCLELSFLMDFIEFSVKNTVELHSQILFSCMSREADIFLLFSQDRSIGMHLGVLQSYVRISRAFK